LTVDGCSERVVANFGACRDVVCAERHVLQTSRSRP